MQKKYFFRLLLPSVIFLIAILFSACDDSSSSNDPDTIPADAKTITSFAFTDPAATGTINQTDHTISVTVPYDTEVSSLAPEITYMGASISPDSDDEQDFTGEVIYTVTARDSSTQEYRVTVVVAPNQVGHVRLQNDTQGYYTLNNAIINGVNFGSIGFEETTEYMDLSSLVPIDVAIGMYNEIYNLNEGTATESTWSWSGTFSVGVYYTVRFYYHQPSNLVRITITTSDAPQGDPIYTDLPDPTLIIENDTDNTGANLTFQDVTVNEIDFGTIEYGQSSSAMTVNPLIPISLTMDIFNTGGYLGTATEDDWNITGNFLKGMTYRFRFYTSGPTMYIDVQQSSM